MPHRKPKKPKALQVKPVKPQDAVDASLWKKEIWVNTAEVMKLLNLSRSSVHRLRIKGELPSSKLGGTVMYPKSFISRLLFVRMQK